jgi:outer membrane lipoprotein-sorting protein
VDLPTLLELLYSASDRSRTVHATVRRTSRQGRELEILRLRGLYRDPPPIPAEEGSWQPPSALIEVETRLWWARPDWLRWEAAFAGDSKPYQTSAGVKHGEIFWSRFGDREDVHTNESRPSRGTMTTDEERLLNPSPLLGAYRFTLGQSTERLGRPAIMVEASRRSGIDFHGFGPLADRLRLALDQERGILLRAAVIVEDEEITCSEIVDLAFDEPISPELFEPLR